MEGNLNFGDYELVNLKAYIESVKPKLQKGDQKLSAKAPERNKRISVVVADYNRNLCKFGARFGLAGSQLMSM